MNSAEKQENIIILNPKWTVDLHGNLVIQPSLESFQAAMQYIETCRERIGTIMMLVDVPPRVQHATQIFSTKSDARNKNRRLFGMRHLGQFASGIQEYYLNNLPTSITVEDIRILTETMIREIVVNLPKDCRDRLPKCRTNELCGLPNGERSAGCLEITIASLLFALNPAERGNILGRNITDNKLNIFAQTSDNLPGEYIMEAPEHLPKGSWKRTIVK